MFNFRLKNAKTLQFVLDNTGISLLNRDGHHVSVQEFVGNPEVESTFNVVPPAV